ncbi:hypothetical protein FBR01_20070 [Anaerolineae bacterium CFX8]|nr:hypothetical protein [Anaerolineae bacterium CFX8]
MLRRRKSPGKCWTGRKNAADPSTTPFQLLFLDETSLSLHPILRRCWMKRGQRKRIPAPGTPEFCHVFGAYNWRTGKTNLHRLSRTSRFHRLPQPAPNPGTG